jgi:hypothetical protein
VSPHPQTYARPPKQCAANAFVASNTRSNAHLACFRLYPSPALLSLLQLCDSMYSWLHFQGLLSYLISWYGVSRIYGFTDEQKTKNDDFSLNFVIPDLYYPLYSVGHSRCILRLYILCVLGYALSFDSVRIAGQSELGPIHCPILSS